jgi:hypothetical protein
MRRRAPWIALAVLALGASAARAQVKGPAELLPASTLASVELRQPARLSRELAALVKGSAFDDMPGAIARFRAKHANADQMWFLSEIASFSMFLCPEMLSEGARLRGGILGLTGIDKEKGPRYAGVLLTGDSNAPGIYYRGTMSFGNVRQAGQCEGVSIYQERRFTYSYAPAMPGGSGSAPTRREEGSGTAMALLPGALVFGSSPDAVKDVIRRLKGKSGDPSLASVSAYREMAERDNKAGLFAYADVAALAAAVDESMQKANQGSAAEWRALKALLNPKAVRSVTASLTLHNGTVELLARVRTDAKEKSPLLDLLPDRKAPVELLHFVPRDAIVTAAAGLTDGGQRWEKALKLLDTVVNVSRPGDVPARAVARPSDVVRELERKAKLNLGKDLFGRLSGVSVFLDAPVGTRPGGPVLVLQGTDAKAARALEEEALPKLCALLGAGEAPAPVREEVDGQPIHSAAGLKLPWGEGAYFGRSGAVLVFGPDRKRVAEALAAGRKKSGLAADEAVLAGVKELNAAVVGVAAPGLLVAELYKATERAAGRPVVGVKMGAGGPPPVPVPAREKPVELPDGVQKTAKTLARAFEPLPPLVFGLTRQSDALALTVRQPQLRRASARAIDVWVESAMERAARRPFGYGTAIKTTTAPVEVRKLPAPARDKKKE